MVSISNLSNIWQCCSYTTASTICRKYHRLSYCFTNYLKNIRSLKNRTSMSLGFFFLVWLWLLKKNILFHLQISRILSIVGDPATWPAAIVEAYWKISVDTFYEWKFSCKSVQCSCDSYNSMIENLCHCGPCKINEGHISVNETDSAVKVQDLYSTTGRGVVHVYVNASAEKYSG